MPTALVIGPPDERVVEINIALKSAGFDVVIADAEAGGIPGDIASISCYIQMPQESPTGGDGAVAWAHGAVGRRLLTCFDVTARVAALLTPDAGLLRMLIMAILGDYGRDRVRVAVVDDSSAPGDIAAFALSEAPSWTDYRAMAPDLAYADWRNEVISVKTSFDWGG